MSKFKIGDRVVVTHSTYEKFEDVIGKTGTVVAFDKDGDEVLELDGVDNTYDSNKWYTDYVSKKHNLYIVDWESDDTIELIV